MFYLFHACRVLGKRFLTSKVTCRVLGKRFSTPKVAVKIQVHFKSTKEFLPN
jgi:hypothetical protein